MMSIPVRETLESLASLDDGYPRAALDAAVALQEEITPALLRELVAVRNNPQRHAERRSYDRHLYALVLLGHFREVRAHDLIADLFGLAPPLPNRLFGVMCTETLPVLLLRTHPGSTERIRGLVVDNGADPYCRGSAATAMSMAVAAGQAPRQEVVEFLGTLFTGEEADLDSDFWSFIACEICDLFPGDLMDVIEDAYARDLISPDVVEFEEFRRALAMGEDVVLAELRCRLERKVPRTIHHYMAWWACFGDDGRR